MIVGISDLKFTQKPTNGQIVNNSLSVCDMSVRQLAECISNGQTFSNAFKGKRGKDNFDKTDLIVLDIDHQTFLLDYIKTIVNGIIYYPTFSDGKDDLHSYRVIVRLNEAITTRDEYAFYANILIKMLEQKGVMVDQSCNQAERMFYGTKYKVEIYETDYNYTKFYLRQYAKDNNFDLQTLSQTKTDKCTKQKKEPQKTKENGLKTDYRGNLISDFMAGRSFKYILKDHIYDYEIIQKPKIDWKQDELYRVCDDYIEVCNRWKNKKIEKYRIGENRKDKMFWRLVIRKQIKPEISFEELLINCCWDMEYVFENKDNKLDREWLLHIVRMVFEGDYKTKTKQKTKLNIDLIKEQGLSWQSVVQKKRRNENENNILSCFDNSINLKKNYEKFTSNGFKISYDCYKRLSKELNLNYKGKHK